MAGKTVQASAVGEHVYKIFPNDINSHATVFGGMIMATIDRISLVVAERHAGHICVTASVDGVHFLAPSREGDTLIFSAACNRAWRSSMEIGCRVTAENSYTGERRHIVSAYSTFVALNRDMRPVPVPELITESAREAQRHHEAGLRRQARLAHAEALKNIERG